MWLSKKVTALEKGTGELKRALHEIGTKLSLQETATRGVEERCAKLETAIIQIVEVVQQQNSAIDSSGSLPNNLVEEVNIHRNNFQNVGMIIQIHEQSIVLSGVVTPEMTQNVNALIREMRKVRGLQA